MNWHRYILILLAMVLVIIPTQARSDKQELSTTRDERVHIRKGNKLYKQERYAEAEVEYRKAAQANPGSAIAAFNLASSLLKQGNGSMKNEDQNNPVNQALTQLDNVVKTCTDPALTSKAFYNMGNVAFNREEWDKAIEFYKNALRRNPSDDEARDNLRLAQLKKKENEQNQNQQQQQNQDQQQNKQDKQEDKQDKQDQPQDQSQDKNQQQQQQQQQSGMSQQNVEQVLKTMQDKEQETQRKVNASQAEKQKAERNRTRNQW